MSLDNIAITISGTPDQLAPVTALLGKLGHTIRLVDLPEMLLECDMTPPAVAVVERRGHARGASASDGILDELRPAGSRRATGGHISRQPAAEGAGNDGPTGGDISPASTAHDTEPDTTTPTAATDDPENVEPEPAPDLIDAEAWAAANPAIGAGRMDPKQLGQLAAELAADDGPTEAELTEIETTPDDVVDELEEISDDQRIVNTRSAILSHRIEALFRIHPDREWTAPTMFEHLPGVHGTGAISAALSGLTSAGRAIRVGRGRYRPAPPGPEPLRDTLLRILRCDPDPAKTWSLDELADYTGDDHSDIHEALLELHVDGLLVADPNDTDEHQAVPA